MEGKGENDAAAARRRDGLTDTMIWWRVKAFGVNEGLIGEMVVMIEFIKLQTFWEHSSFSCLAASPKLVVPAGTGGGLR